MKIFLCQIPATEFVLSPQRPPQRPPQQVAQNQIRLNLCDLLRPKNSVAETKISRKILQYTQGDSSLLRSVVQLVAASDRENQMGAKKPKPEKIPGPKLTPKKSHAEFPSLKNIQKALNSFLKTKSGCTLFAEFNRPGRDTWALQRIFRLI